MLKISRWPMESQTLSMETVQKWPSHSLPQVDHPDIVSMATGSWTLTMNPTQLYIRVRIFAEEGSMLVN